MVPLILILVPLITSAATWVTAAGAQDETAVPRVSIPVLPASGASPAAFAPAGRRVETSASGDLNGDGAADIAFTLRPERPVDTSTDIGMGAGRTFDSRPRILGVAFARPRGGYALAAQNHRLIPRPLDPTQAEWMFEDGSLAIERRALVVRLAFLSSSVGATSYRLRWQGDAFRLIGFDVSDANRSSGCLNLLSVNYLTGRVKRTTGNVSDDQENVVWSRLRAGPPTLDQIGDGTQFDPEGLVSGMGQCLEDRDE